MIENLKLMRPGGRTEREVIVDIEAKINELIDAYNEHQHEYPDRLLMARKLTSKPSGDGGQE